MSYGQELIMDLVGCNVKLFDRVWIEAYLEKLCLLLEVTREDLHWWDYDGLPEEYAKAPPHMKGTSVVQFISKSTVVIHTLDASGMIMINVFSCGEFHVHEVRKMTREFFGGTVELIHNIQRGGSWSE